MSVKITLELPDDLARRADAAGLLDDIQLLNLIESALSQHTARKPRFSDDLPSIDLGPWPENFKEEREGCRRFSDSLPSDNLGSWPENFKEER